MDSFQYATSKTAAVPRTTVARLGSATGTRNWWRLWELHKIVPEDDP
jgi:hypothetical protein